MKEKIASFELLNSNPTQRDPRVCPFGVFLAHSMSAGGDQAFFWFMHEIEAVQFLIEKAGETTAFEEFETLLSNVMTFEEMPVEMLNAWQTSFTIRWIGRYEELLDCQSRFCCEIRHDFMPIYVNRVFQDTDKNTIDRFIEHLGRYVERFPAKTFVSGFRFSPIKD